MSRYMLNKFMQTVEMSDREVQAYVADPRGYVTTWLQGGAGPDQRPDDRALQAEEREAFATRDYAALYRLGAHPYLLWHFTEAVHIHEVSWPALTQAYRDAVRPFGYPDFIV